MLAGDDNEVVSLENRRAAALGRIVEGCREVSGTPPRLSVVPRGEGNIRGLRSPTVGDPKGDNVSALSWLGENAVEPPNEELLDVLTRGHSRLAVCSFGVVEPLLRGFDSGDRRSLSFPMRSASAGKGRRLT